jgi:hypothetical protein
MAENTLNCRQVHQAYSVYLQGKLTPNQMEWVANHIKDCPDCYLLDQNVRKSFLEEKIQNPGG